MACQEILERSTTNRSMYREMRLEGKRTLMAYLTVAAITVSVQVGGLFAVDDFKAYERFVIRPLRMRYARSKKTDLPGVIFPGDRRPLRRRAPPGPPGRLYAHPEEVASIEISVEVDRGSRSG
jgi:hypothetical protein